MVGAVERVNPHPLRVSVTICTSRLQVAPIINVHPNSCVADLKEQLCSWIDRPHPVSLSHKHLQSVLETRANEMVESRNPF